MTPQRLSDRQFGTAVAVVLLAIAGIGGFAFGAVPRWAVIGAAGVGLVALLAPGLLLPFNRLWEAFAMRLGRLVNFVLLAAFFYVFVLPLGLVIRLFGHDAMHRKPDPASETYWTPVTRHTDETTLRDMF